RVAEGSGMVVHVGRGRRRAHEGHVVERRHQDAPVEGVEVKEALELVVAARRGLRAVAWRRRAEAVLHPATEPGDMPWRLVGDDHVVDAGLEALAELDHALEGLLGEDPLERRPCRRQGEGVAGKRAAYPADVADL